MLSHAMRSGCGVNYRAAPAKHDRIDRAAADFA
jgi:hypothetical protein